MSVASEQQTVQVQGVQPLVQTEDASLGVVVDADSAANLPLNGRKFTNLAILTPGVTVYDPDSHSSSTDGSAISAYGSQVTWAQVNAGGAQVFFLTAKTGVSCGAPLASYGLGGGCYAGKKEYQFL